jgi:tetratricopeptide (TPR) repeat protein
MPTPRTRSAIARAALFAGLIGVLAAAIACGTPDILNYEAPDLTDRNRALYARINLEKARALRAEGRLDHAESVTRRGLSFEPDNPELLRLRANLLESLGRGEEAQALAARADEIAPPLPTLPESPHPSAAPEANVLVVLLPPAPSLLGSPARSRVPTHWPRGAEAATLVERLRVRLPNAALEVVANDEHPTARSVPEVQAWLDSQERPDAVVSLRIDRAFCGTSVKDGDFAVAWLRIGVAVPGPRASAAHLVRVALDTPQGEGCEAAAVARALERALEVVAVQEVLSAADPAKEADRAFSNTAVRVAFPTLDWRLQESLAQGRRYLSIGELAHALRHFRTAEGIDPEDPVVHAFLDETERSLALARLLEPVTGATEVEAENSDHLGAQLSSSQRTGLEAQLAHEQRRREEMMAALAVLYEMRSAPSLGTVAKMRPGEVSDPTATGVALALDRIPRGGNVEIRTLYAPDGGVLARYYFEAGDETPVLREEDTAGDGVPDRWIGYDEGGVVSEVWESNVPGDPPSLHLVYGPGGKPVERVEIDQDADGRLDRVFVYSEGLLRRESWDTDGDGSYDRFQHFDESGSLTMREEDVDGDDEIDVRTAYNKGRIVRREILNADLLSEVQ